MPRRGSKRPSTIPDVDERLTISLKPESAAARGYVRAPRSSCASSSSSSSAIGLFRCIRASVVRALRFISRRQRSARARDSSVVLPRQFAPPRDSYQSEAIEDCIEFINSSYKNST